MKAIEEIKKMVKAAQKETDINKLIDLNMRLSGFLVYLQEDISARHKAFLIAYRDRKLSEAQFVVKSDSGVTKAEREAIIDTRLLKETEVATETIYKYMVGVAISASDFVKVLTQKISSLRKEDEYSRRANS